MAMASPEDEFSRRFAEAKVNPKSVHLKNMDEVTLIVAPESADACFEALSQALTAPCGTRPMGHRGFIVCGFPAT